MSNQKSVVLIRHGKSQAQGTDKTERRLEKYNDCHCSRTGISQAYAIPDLMGGHEAMATFDLVVTSPLSRAITTALIAFRDHPEVPMVVHPGCKELGSSIPENRARSVNELKRDPQLAGLPRFDDLNFDMLPAGWPIQIDQSESQNVLRKSRHRAKSEKKKPDFLYWLASQPYQRIAVFTHHNMIVSMLGEVKVENAFPIGCLLASSGEIRVLDGPVAPPLTPAMSSAPPLSSLTPREAISRASVKKMRPTKAERRALKEAQQSAKPTTNTKGSEDMKASTKWEKVKPAIGEDSSAEAGVLGAVFERAVDAEVAPGSRLWVFKQTGGSLAASGAPSRKKEGIQRAHSSGVTAVLTLLRADEATGGGPGEIACQCLGLGMYWRHFPLSGKRALESTLNAKGQQLASDGSRGGEEHGDKTTLDEAVADVVRLVRSGEHVLVHCSAGLHRTGVVCYLSLRRLGLSAQETIQALESMRPATAQELIRDPGPPQGALQKTAERWLAENRSPAQLTRETPSNPLPHIPHCRSRQGSLKN